jgi:hypothetical protein
MHLLPSVAIQPNLELKIQPKQLLGYLLLVIVLPALANRNNPNCVASPKVAKASTVRCGCH